MCTISKERIAFSTQVEGSREEVFAASPITSKSRCKHVPKEPIRMYGHSWPATQECAFKIGDRQSEKKPWNCDQQAECNTTRGIDAGSGVNRHHINTKHFTPGGMAPLESTGSVRAVSDTWLADYPRPGVNTTHRVASCPPIAVSPFLLALTVSYFKQTLWRCGQL